MADIETEKRLSDLMEFDCVIEVHEDGTVTRAPREIHGPDVWADESDPRHPDSEDWELLNGYSGQYSYPGPVMHDSEFLGGPMVDDILAKPGYYVITACHWWGVPEDQDDIEGWVVAYRPGG